MNLKKKIGPLPVWAWGLILGAVGYYAYTRYSSASGSSSTTSGTLGVLDPNAVDPNTGLTYGQEEDAALNANAAGSAGIGTSGTVGDSSAQGTVTPPNEFGDFLTFLDEFNQFATTMGWQAPTAPPGATASPTTTTAVTSPPVTTAHPPTVTATTHASPIQTQDQTVLGQISSLLSSGFKKVPGTTQAGGLAQTGTYVYTPPKLKPGKGGGAMSVTPATTKYFVYGTSATGLHIRAAK